MNLILVLIVGGLFGWVASIVMRTNAEQGILLNVVVGIVGALLAGFLLAPLFGTGTITQGIQPAGSAGLAARLGDPARDRQPVPPRLRALNRKLKA